MISLSAAGRLSPLSTRGDRFKPRSSNRHGHTRQARPGYGTAYAARDLNHSILTRMVLAVMALLIERYGLSDRRYAIMSVN
jgi:hypothetical protein